MDTGFGGLLGNRFNPDLWSSLDDPNWFASSPADILSRGSARRGIVHTITPKEINQIWSNCYYSHEGIDQLLLMPLEEIEAEDLFDALSRAHQSTRESCDSNFLLMLRLVESSEQIDRIDDRLLSTLPLLGLTEGENIHRREHARDEGLRALTAEAAMNSKSPTNRYDTPRIHLTHVVERQPSEVFADNPLQSPLDRHCDLTP